MITLNGKPINVTIFPDKTSQVWKLPDEVFVSKDVKGPHLAKVEWRFEHEGEFMHLAQLKDLLSCCANPYTETRLHLPYLPYARQDKEVSNNATFALRTFAAALNDLGFDIVTCMDPHSKEAGKLIHRFKALYPKEEVAVAASLVAADLFCYPDKGALSKYTEIYKYPYIYGEKVRDQSTGNILSYKLMGAPEGKNILIIDDICDGGMTFILLAKDLMKAGAKNVNLFVSHGIFSKGLGPLYAAGIKRIFTKEGECEVK